MGVDVRLEDEEGEQLSEWVGDPRMVFARALPAFDDTPYVCLRFVDRYGDTTFNESQMPVLIEELSRLGEGADEELAEILGQIQRLAERAVEEGPHVYLKFYGD